MVDDIVDGGVESRVLVFVICIQQKYREIISEYDSMEQESTNY